MSFEVSVCFVILTNIEICDGCWIVWRSLRPLVCVMYLYQTIASLLRNCPTLERSDVALDAAHSQSSCVCSAVAPDSQQTNFLKLYRNTVSL
jgi:hypothetical protein